MAKKIREIIDSHFELTKNSIVYISGDYTEFHLKKKIGDVLSIYDNTNDLRQDWNYYNNIHGEDFIRLLDAFMQEYNPIENYDRYEDTNIQFSQGEQTNRVIAADKTGHTENKTSAYDSEGYSDLGRTDTTQNGYTDTAVNGNREDSTDTTSHIHGNIGITTNAQMLQGEALIRYNNLVDKYIDRWAQGVIVGYDDAGYTSYDPTPSDDYATKEELNEVKSDVTRLENTVGSVSDDVTTLYGQVDGLRTDLTGVDDLLQSTISDVEDIKNELDAFNVYSTDEHMIGKWINNKNIYEKTYYFPDISAATTQAPEAIQGLDEVVELKGTFFSEHYNQWYAENNIHLSNYLNDYYILTIVNAGKPEIRLGSAHQQYHLKGYLTVKYTKN